MDFFLITKANEHLFQLELDAFFRARHAVYADELRWVPTSPDGLEIDRFDTASATYLVMMENGEFVAGSRLVPTHLPHLLSEVFPNSCDLLPMPRSPDVVEWTRGFIVAHRRDKGSVRILAQACAAVMEYCLSQGYSQVGGIQDQKWIPLWNKMDWSIHIHGQPITIDGSPWQPIYFDVTEAAMLAARKLGRLTGPVLHHFDEQRAA